MPTYCARVRSTLTSKLGLLFDCWTRASARPEHNEAAAVLRIGKVRGLIRTADLEVDRRGRAEVQDLADDVSGEERERHARKPRRQFFAQGADVVGVGL